MLIGAPPQGPTELAFGFCNCHIINAGMAHRHIAMLVKFPIFISVTAPPLTVFILPFISKTHGNSISMPGPDFFNQAVFTLFLPFAFQGRLNLISPLRTFAAIAPARIHGICLRHLDRFTTMPGILGGTHFLAGTLQIERWQGRTCIHSDLLENKSGPDSLAAKRKQSLTGRY